MPPTCAADSTAPAAGADRVFLADGEAVAPGRVSFWLGVILILSSFGTYSAYPMLPFLPISMWQKGGVGIGLAAVSWGMFFAGSALVGKNGMAYLKRRLFKSGGDLTRGVTER